jgi:chromosome partitioning protein
VLAVDLDPQACLTFSLGLDPENLELSIHDVLLGRVSIRMVIQQTSEGPDVLPSTIDLAGAEAMLLMRTGREYTLKHALDEIRSSYDVILLDCAPTLGVLTINALTAADEVIVPLQCETLSHRGVGQLLDTVRDVQRLTNPDLSVRGVLPTLFDGRTLHTRAVLADIALRYGLDVLDPPIPRSIRFAEAPAVGQTIMATARRTPGAQAYRTLARRLIGLPDEETPAAPSPAAMASHPVAPGSSNPGASNPGASNPGAAAPSIMPSTAPSPAAMAARSAPTSHPDVSADSDAPAHDDGPQLRYDADADDYVATPTPPAVQRAVPNS